MRLFGVIVLVLVLAMGAVPAGAADVDEGSENMELIGRWDDGGEYRQGTDLAFWGDLAVLGRYEGLRLLDVADPSTPALVGSLDCAGNQNDVSIWGHLVFISVDSPMAHDGCDAPAAAQDDIAAGDAWEGIRIIDVSDPTAPRQVHTVYTDCGSHTHTLVPDVRHRDWITGERSPRVLLYSSSYPLGGQGSRCNAASHRKVSVVEVPLRSPSQARVVGMPDVSPAVGCHDITVFMPRKLAVAACITETQIWDISDPARPVTLSTIRNDRMQIHHSAAVSWDGDIAVLGDEKGGAAAASGCMAGGTEPTGALWFYDISDPVRPRMQSWFVIPQDEVSTMCTAHNFNVVPVREDKRILVTSWYHGGTHVIDFTDASDPQQIGWYKAKEGVRGTPWSSYWYNGRIYANNFDAGYVPSVPESRGLDVFAVDHPDLQRTRPLRYLNPQTQMPLRGMEVDAQGLPVSPEVRAQALAAPRPAPAAQLPAAAGQPLPFCLLAG